MDPRIKVIHGKATISRENGGTYQVITVNMSDTKFLYPESGPVEYFRGYPVFRLGDEKYTIIPDVDGMAVIFPIPAVVSVISVIDSMVTVIGRDSIQIFPVRGFESLAVPDSVDGYRDDGKPIFAKDGARYYFDTIRTDTGPVMAAIFLADFGAGDSPQLMGSFPWMLTAGPSSIFVTSRDGVTTTMLDPADEEYQKYKTPDVFVKWLETGEPVFRLNDVEYYFISKNGVGHVVRISGRLAADDIPTVINAAYLPHRYKGMWKLCEAIKAGDDYKKLLKEHKTEVDRATKVMLASGINWEMRHTHSKGVYLWLTHLHLNGILATDCDFTWDVSETWELPTEHGGTSDQLEYPTWDPYLNRPNYTTGFDEYYGCRLVCKKIGSAETARALYDEYTKGFLMRPVETDKAGFPVGEYAEADDIHYYRTRFPIAELNDDTSELYKWHAARWFCYYIMGHIRRYSIKPSMPEAPCSKSEFREFKRFFWSMPPNEVKVSIKAAKEMMGRLGYDAEPQEGVGMLGAMTSALALGYMATDFTGRYPIPVEDFDKYDRIYPVFKIDEPRDSPSQNFVVEYGGRWFQWNIHRDRAFLVRNSEGKDNIANMIGDSWKISSYDVESQYNENSFFGYGVKNFCRNPITKQPVGSDDTAAKLFKFIEVNTHFPMAVVWGTLGFGLGALLIGGGLAYEGIPPQVAIIVGGSVFAVGTFTMVLAYLPQLLQWVSARVAAGGSAVFAVLTGGRIYD